MKMLIILHVTYSVHYLYYDNHPSKNYEIDPYSTFEDFCKKCNTTFYIRGLYTDHQC